MTVKAYISDLTWRTREYQINLMSSYFGEDWKDVAVYEGEDDIDALLRPTNRNGSITLAVSSLAVLAKEQKEFDRLLKLMRRRKMNIYDIEYQCNYHPTCNKTEVLKDWAESRIRGSAKIGATVSAKKAEAESKAACEKIRERWPKPNQEWSTPVLLKEAGISYNTAIKYLGKRPIAQYNYQAKLKRQARKGILQSACKVAGKR